MKNNYIWSAIAAFISSFLFYACSGTGNIGKLNQEEVARMIDNKSFIFVAEKVSPLTGRTRILSSRYDVRVSGDSLVSYLPYFGRAYSAPMNTGEVSTHFTSTDFTFTVERSDKGKWNIKINPADAPQIQELNFSIFENGTTTLNLLSTSKSAISYYGHIEKIKE